jgi:serine/threonine protein kinase
MASSLDLFKGGQVPEKLPEVDDYLGKVVSGKYRIEKLIGVGSMGMVFSANHIELDERVAIKSIRAEIQQIPGIVSRFAREAKATARLKNAHIARVMDAGVSELLGPYIVMEYLDGKTLYDVLTAKGPFDVRQAVFYILQALEALASAHAMDIVHRDIKPENLFVTRHENEDCIKLIDFGVSKGIFKGRIFGGDLQDPDVVGLLGSPLYMSPEQINASEDVDHRTDIWSIGVVLYELITGRDAFEADNIQNILIRILKKEPATIEQHKLGIPRGLQTIITRCLQKDPDRRYRDVMELALALQSYAPSKAQVHVHRICSIMGKIKDSECPSSYFNMPKIEKPVYARRAIPLPPEPRFRPNYLGYLPFGIAVIFLAVILFVRITPEPVGVPIIMPEPPRSRVIESPLDPHPIVEIVEDTPVALPSPSVVEVVEVVPEPQKVVPVPVTTIPRKSKPVRSRPVVPLERPIEVSNPEDLTLGQPETSPQVKEPEPIRLIPEQPSIPLLD